MRRIVVLETRWFLIGQDGTYEGYGYFGTEKEAKEALKRLSVNEKRSLQITSETREVES